MQCHKNSPNPTKPEDQLPAATQTGAGTFGCLVNGQPWTPRGNDGTSNYSIYFDPSYRKGTVNIAAYRYESKGSGTRQDIIIFSDSLVSTGTYSLQVPNHQEGLFYGSKGQCEFYQNGSHYRRGSLTITRLDKQKGIIAGTFSFTLYRPGCDTVRVTQGRFDKQL